LFKWGKRQEIINPEGLNKIQILPNEAISAQRSKPNDLSEQEWYEANRHRLDLTSRLNNITARKGFAWAIFVMVLLWLVAVLWIVYLSDRHFLVLDKAVLIALIISGSVNVIGLFSNVAKYLFHVHETQIPIVEAKASNVSTMPPSRPGREIPEVEDTDRPKPVPRSASAELPENEA